LSENALPSDGAEAPTSGAFSAPLVGNFEETAVAFYAHRAAR